MRLPDFICIGAQRAGTTWLYRMLSRHPGVFMPDQKELHFFDERPDFSRYEGIWNPVRSYYYDMNSAADWRWYGAHFSKCGKKQLAGEITPFYATLSEERVRVISRRLAGLRTIYILRDPVQRAWSNFRLSWKNHTRTQACDLTEDLIHKTIFYPAKLVHGEYRRNIAVWEKCFPPDSMLYLFYDDIVQAPRGVLEQVCDFLKIAPLRAADADLSEKVNQAPEMNMPERIESRLRDHYAGQTAFLKERFGRTLCY